MSGGFRPDEHLDEMEQEKAGDGAGGDGQRVDAGGHHQHSALTYFYSILLPLSTFLKRNLSEASIRQSARKSFFIKAKQQIHSAPGEDYVFKIDIP